MLKLILKEKIMFKCSNQNYISDIGQLKLVRNKKVHNIIILIKEHMNKSIFKGLGSRAGFLRRRGRWSWTWFLCGLRSWFRAWFWGRFRCSSSGGRSGSRCQSSRVLAHRVDINLLTRIV